MAALRVGLLPNLGRIWGADRPFAQLIGAQNSAISHAQVFCVFAVVAQDFEST